MVDKLLKKETWKDIFIMIVLLGVNFLEGTMFKRIKPILILYIVIASIVAIYTIIYIFYNCPKEKRKKLFLLYLVPLLFFYHKDVADVLIYLTVAILFVDKKEPFLRIYLIASISMIVFTICADLLGLLPTAHYIRTDSSDIRYHLGFIHPNVIFRHYMGALMALYLLDKNKIIFNVFTISTGITLYLLTDSRTGIICTIFFLIIADINKLFPKLFPFIFNKKVFKYSYFIYAVIVLILVVALHEVPEINDLLSARPSSLYNHLKNAGWHLLYGYAPAVWCDNRIVYILIRNGILFLIIVSMFYYFSFKKEENIELKILYVVALVYGLTENFVNLGQNIVPVFCLWSLYNNYCINKETSKNNDVNTGNINQELYNS